MAFQDTYYSMLAHEYNAHVHIELEPPHFLALFGTDMHIQMWDDPVNMCIRLVALKGNTQYDTPLYYKDAIPGVMPRNTDLGWSLRDWLQAYCRVRYAPCKVDPFSAKEKTMPHRSKYPDWRRSPYDTHVVFRPTQQHLRSMEDSVKLGFSWQTHIYYTNTMGIRRGVYGGTKVVALYQGDSRIVICLQGERPGFRASDYPWTTLCVFNDGNLQLNQIADIAFGNTRKP